MNPHDPVAGAPTAKRMHIELREVVKRYGQVRALNRVSMQIAPGQIVTVLGANGAGKTSLLRCLAGVLSPDKGEIFYDGEPFRRDRLDMRRRFCFLPDFPPLFVERPILRNVSIFLQLYCQEDPGVEDVVLELLREFDLLPLAETPVAFLSRGQAYKAALVALMAAEPAVWLLDEPFASGMDPHGIETFKRRARRAVERGCTVIYTTQLLDLAERFSDRVCVINDGEVAAFDTMDALRSRSADKLNPLAELLARLRDPL